MKQAKELADINDRAIKEQDLQFLISKDFNKYCTLRRDNNKDGTIC